MTRRPTPTPVVAVETLNISADGVTRKSEAFGISPQWDYLVVRQPERADRTRDGSVLILPGVGADKNEAIVLAVGPGVLHDGKKVPMPFAPGDRVILAQASYHPLHVDGENLLLVKAGLVLAVVTKEDAILLNAGGKKNYAAQYEAHHVDDD